MMLLRTTGVATSKTINNTYPPFFVLNKTMSVLNKILEKISNINTLPKDDLDIELGIKYNDNEKQNTKD
jgi:hypothetical protein